MKFLKMFSLIFVAIGIFTLFACGTVSASDAYVTVDINPSIELVVTPKEKVIYANALNEDAEVLLSNITVVGLYLDEAMDLIIETAIDLGFIDVEATEGVEIEVTTISKSNQIGERIQERIKEHINNAFGKRAMLGRAVDKEYVQEFLNEAQSLGVTPGFLRLAKSVLLITDEYTIEELIEMDQEELINILKEFKDQNKQIIHQLREDFLIARRALFDEYIPQIEALEAQLLEEDADVEAIQAELDALKLEFREKFEALRTEFLDQSQVMRQQMVQVHMQRRMMNQEKVEDFKSHMEERRQEMKDQIEEFQGRRP
jgi:acid stress-induced BolA-like protein IbaG/YrbA